MTDEQNRRLRQFQSAKKVALEVPSGTFRRARDPKTNQPTAFFGFRGRDGRCWVLCEKRDILINPDAKFDTKIGQLDGRIIQDFQNLQCYETKYLQ